MREPITSETQGQALYTDVLDHLRDRMPQPIRLKREDFTGALANVLIAAMSVLPALVPLVLLRNYPESAVRTSNIISFIILFISGYQWGQYTGANPWKTGLLLVGAGVLMLAVAIPLGG